MNNSPKPGMTAGDHETSENDMPQDPMNPTDQSAEFDQDDDDAINEEELLDPIAELQRQNAELNDQILRLAAELENTRRRAEREKNDAGRYAIQSFARDLLPVSDNFERALAAAPTDGADAGVLQGLVDGVRMTEKELLSVLERHGVKKIDPTGERFDPNLHQAVAQAPAPGVPADHVAQTAQTGFVLGDRVLRAAMVIVSTGGPTDQGGQDQSEKSAATDGNDDLGANLDTNA